MRAAAERGLLCRNADAAERREPLDPDEDDERLTDDDLFALLCRDGMGGFNGLTRETYSRTPDRIIRDSYFAPRDEDHELIPYRLRWKRVREGWQSGSPDRAGKELPRAETLNIPPEAFGINNRVGMDYTIVFWQCWKRRQRKGVLTENGQAISDEYILNRYRAKVSQGLR